MQKSDKLALLISFTMFVLPNVIFTGLLLLSGGCGSDDSKKSSTEEILPINSLIQADGENGIDGKNGVDGVNGKDGKDANKLFVIDGDGNQLGQYAGTYADQISILIDGKVINIVENRLDEITPFFSPTSNTNNCFYKSNDCSGSCYLNYNAPTSFLSIGKDSLYKIDFENGNQEETVSSNWQADQCNVISATLQKARIGIPMSELNHLLNIKGPISIEGVK